MHAGMNALRWGLPRLALVVGMIVFIPVFLYAMIVTVVVVGQAITAFGQ